jgi:hemolysin III
MFEKRNNRVIEQSKIQRVRGQKEPHLHELAGPVVKPLLRGWFHAGAALVAIITTLVLCWLGRTDLARCISLLIFGLSMIELYTVSAIYHIGRWSSVRKQFFRKLDHANIFIFIAGTYTPLCYAILAGWLRVAFLIAIWALALLGVVCTLFSATLKLPRWVGTLLYVVMGWIALLAIPAFLAVRPWAFVWMLISGGLLYTLGAVIYALRWPNPFPRIFGYHEIFHLFVIAGSIAFTIAIWIWALPITAHAL